MIAFIIHYVTHHHANSSLRVTSARLGRLRLTGYEYLDNYVNSVLSVVKV